VRYSAIRAVAMSAVVVAEDIAEFRVDSASTKYFVAVKSSL